MRPILYLLICFSTFCIAERATVAFAQNSENERGESYGREAQSSRRSDGGMRKVSGVPLPGASEMTPLHNFRAHPHEAGPREDGPGEVPFGRKTFPMEPSTVFPARAIFLNGTNIGSVRDQTLENVKVKIDSEGNIHMTAAHYDVHEESSYHPLFSQELPRVPKAASIPEELPQGVFSKQGPESPKKPIDKNVRPEKSADAH